MADIRINVKKAEAFSTMEKTVEITGVDYINDELLKAIIDKLNGSPERTKQEEGNKKPTEEDDT